MHVHGREGIVGLPEYDQYQVLSSSMEAILLLMDRFGIWRQQRIGHATTARLSRHTYCVRMGVAGSRLLMGHTLQPQQYNTPGGDWISWLKRCRR